MTQVAVGAVLGLLSILAISGCTGTDDVPKERSPITSGTEKNSAGAIGSASNLTLLRFQAEPKEFRDATQGEGTLSPCLLRPTCEGERHGLPLDLPQGAYVMLTVQIDYASSGVTDVPVVADLELDDGTVWKSSTRSPGQGVTEIVYVFETQSGSGHLFVHWEGISETSSSYSFAGEIWFDSGVVPAGVAIGLSLGPGANVSVESVLTPAHESPEPIGVGFVLYDDNKQPVARVDSSNAVEAIRLPEDAAAGAYVLLPIPGSLWFRVSTDYEDLDSLYLIELETVVGPPYALPAPHTEATWTHEVTKMPVAAGFYLRSDVAYLNSPDGGRVTVSSPAGTIIDRDLACNAPSVCASAGPVEVQYILGRGHELLVPGEYEFHVTAGAWGWTHAGAIFVTLP